jgi:hypothetical protein
MDNPLLWFLVGILVVGVLLVVVIMLTKKGHVQLDVNKYRMSWMKIEQALSRDEPSSHLLCILNADKLLDQALRERGVVGETMGERMKQLQTTWSNANAIWSAHKLRNQIAHEHDAKVSYDDTRRALAAFKQALKDIGAI